MSQPIIEVDGKLRFILPGQPLFPQLSDDTILKPTIEWQLQADKAGKLDAQLAYVTGGMSWEANQHRRANLWSLAPPPSKPQSFSFNESRGPLAIGEGGGLAAQWINQFL